MNRIFRKDQVLTIPNLLSLVRLALIPVIVWLYSVKEKYLWAVVVIVLSGVTDVADGIIARKFGMVSDFGKILDPIADKLTQAAIIFCVAQRHRLLYLLIGVFAVKEIVMAVLGLAVIRKQDAVNSAQWHGKVTTVTLYGVMVLLILLPGMPEAVANGLILACIGIILFSFVRYALFYQKILSSK